MAGIISIELNGLRFFATHGVYDEERLLEHEFEVNLVLTIQAPEPLIKYLHETINYVTVYKVVQEEMSKRYQLLETCVMKIAEQLHQQYPQLEAITVSLKKLAPPVTGFTGSVGVTFHQEFKA